MKNPNDLLTVYVVLADRETDRWFSEPINTGRVVSREDWSKMVDSDSVQYFVYERIDFDERSGKHVDSAVSTAVEVHYRTDFHATHSTGNR